MDAFPSSTTIASLIHMGSSPFGIHPRSQTGRADLSFMRSLTENRVALLHSLRRRTVVLAPQGAMSVGHGIRGGSGKHRSFHFSRASNAPSQCAEEAGQDGDRSVPASYTQSIENGQNAKFSKPSRSQSTVKCFQSPFWIKALTFRESVCRLWDPKAHPAGVSVELVLVLCKRG